MNSCNRLGRSLSSNDASSSTDAAEMTRSLSGLFLGDGTCSNVIGKEKQRQNLLTADQEKIRERWSRRRPRYFDLGCARARSRRHALAYGPRQPACARVNDAWRFYYFMDGDTYVIYGLKKLRFNSKDFSTIVCATYSNALDTSVSTGNLI